MVVIELLENGIYSVVPMFIEAGSLLDQSKVFMNLKRVLLISNKLTYEVYVESFKLNNKTENIQDYEMMDPYFYFLENI